MLPSGLVQHSLAQVLNEPESSSVGLAFSAWGRAEPRAHWDTAPIPLTLHPGLEHMQGIVEPLNLLLSLQGQRPFVYLVLLVDPVQGIIDDHIVWLAQQRVETFNDLTKDPRNGIHEDKPKG